MQQTTNYLLKKIDLTDSPPDITAQNPNWDTVDAKLKENADALATHQAENATDAIRPHGMGRIASKDYEEGTWTPVLKGLDVAGVNTYAQQIGVYTKAGNLVHVVSRIDLSLIDPAMAGYLVIDGLPFVSSGSPAVYNVASIEFDKINFDKPSLVLLNNGSRLLLRKRSEVGELQSVISTDLRNNTLIRFSLTYRI